MGSLRSLRRKIKYPKALQCLHEEYLIETAFFPPMPDIDYFMYHSWLCKNTRVWMGIYGFKWKLIYEPIFNRPLKDIVIALKYESDLMKWRRQWETNAFLEEGHFSLKTDYFSFHKCITSMMHTESHAGRHGFGQPWFDFGVLRGLLKGMFRPVIGI